MERPVFHAGEIAMQRAAGSEARMREIGPRVIRDHMPDQHREFFEQLPMLLVGSFDDRQRPWASVLAGLPGFIETPDARHLRVMALPHASDPLAAQLHIGAQLGLLGIEPQTRRRNRMNGTVVANARGFELQVDQSFGNCPKYIQASAPWWTGQTTAVPAVEREGASLSAGAAARIARADTLYIASGVPGEGVDVSHRGGKRGFVRVDQCASGTVLTFPDFIGNFFFNTLGNVKAHPFAGLLFIEHDTGSTLQLTGRAGVVEGGSEVEAFAGAQRLVRIEVDEGLSMHSSLPLRWSEPEFAPQLEATGHW
ncbi:MAG: pyridoxamine 5'-phosphate oxidase family protein [Rhizobiales bacterium]|nr:pyridoxamine 5'-phosphate oxidase family protein [Rhizobacter sp.]